jgi:hypothetical protein
MSLESQEGIVDRLTEKGVVLSGTWFGFSKHLKGPRLTEAHLGHKVTVHFHKYDDRNYIDVVQAVGEKVPGWKPPERSNFGSRGGGGGWRTSPEELELKVATEARIRRERALEFAMTLRERGLSLGEISPEALKLEAFFGTGRMPETATSRKSEVLSPTPVVAATSPVPAKAEKPPVSSGIAAVPAQKAECKEGSTAHARPSRVATRAVSALYNQAMKARVVKDWKDYEALIRKALGRDAKDAYDQSPEDLKRVQLAIEARLAQPRVA